MESVLEMAESKYITGIMSCEIEHLSDIFVINSGCKVLGYGDEHEGYGRGTSSVYIYDIGYSDIEIKYMLAHYICKMAKLYRMSIINIADIHSEIKPRRVSGFYYQTSVYPYHWFNIFKIQSVKYIIITAYDRRKWPIVAIALPSYS